MNLHFGVTKGTLSIFVLFRFGAALLEAILFIHEKELSLTLNRSLQNSCLHVCNYDASVINKGRSCVYGMITKALEMIFGKLHVSTFFLVYYPLHIITKPHRHFPRATHLPTSCTSDYRKKNLLLFSAVLYESQPVWPLGVANIA